MTNTTNITYCDLEDFSHNYKNVHGFLSLAVCIFGSVTNIINICVLRTKQMRSPTNSILTGLAVSDLLVMVQYIPFTVHRNYKILYSNRIIAAKHFSYTWAVFYKFHEIFTLVMHFISCCLTIMLAIWRYIYVSKIHANNVISNYRKTNVAVLLLYLTCPLVCIPLFYSDKITEIKQRVDKRNGVMVENHEVKDYESMNATFRHDVIYILRPNNSHHRFSLYVYTLCLKLIPCVMLSILSYLIISKLVETKKRRRKLFASCNPLQDLTGRQSTLQTYKENQADRTTKMLLAVLLLFLLTEFPQVILGQLGAIYGEVFLIQCYGSLGDIMDMVALINSSINFILYCTMSRQFRKTFQEVFRLRIFFRWLPATPRVRDETAAETKMSLV